MKKNSKSPIKKEPKATRAQAQRPVQRVIVLVRQLSAKYELFIFDSA